MCVVYCNVVKRALCCALKKTRTHERRFMNSASEPYKTVLERQAEERQLRQQVHKQQERVEARQVGEASDMIDSCQSLAAY